MGMCANILCVLECFINKITRKFQFVGLLIDRRHLVLFVLVVSENILKNKDYLHKPFGLIIQMAIFLPFWVMDVEEGEKIENQKVDDKPYGDPYQEESKASYT